MANDSEASPRPWRVSDGDPRVIVDADDKVVCYTSQYAATALSVANAALIVAAVNAAWELETFQRAWYALWPSPSLRVTRTLRDVCDAAAAVVTDPFCARPQEHAPGCECARL